jgi:hypothetical protein
MSDQSSVFGGLGRDDEEEEECPFPLEDEELEACPDR